MYNRELVGSLRNTGSLAWFSVGDLEGVDEAVRGRLKREGMYVSTQLIHFIVQVETKTTL